MNDTEPQNGIVCGRSAMGKFHLLVAKVSACQNEMFRPPERGGGGCWQ